MGRYRVERIVIEGFEVLRLYDDETHSQVDLAPGLGNNVFRFVSEGRDVLSSPERLSLLKEEPFAPFQYGIPILFPPNRVRYGRFRHNGRAYTLPINEPPNHHLHGELCSRAWEVVDIGGSEEYGAYVVSRFRIAEHPDMLAYFPHSLRFTITCRLQDGRLHLCGTIANEGSDEAPFAFGLHPYFAIPAGEELELQLPAAAEWPVTNQAFVTGKPADTEFSRQLRECAPITDYPVLGCSLLSLAEGESTCRIRLARQGYTIAYQLGAEFPYVVLFRPDWSDALSLEPYTAVTDAFNVPYESRMTGARGIASGEVIPFSTAIWVE